jgi:MFS transporter, PPP family, 3-phenylpropionic acid transporter
MRALKAQYFLSYALIGAFVPYLALYFLETGLSKPQIGYIFMTGAIAVILAPVLITFLADAHVDARRIMIVLFLVAGGALGAMHFVRGFWPTLLLYMLHGIAMAPVLPLQDGITFALHAQRKALGQPVEEYHHYRVWGSIGWLFPTVPLYFLMQYGVKVWIIIPLAVAFGILGALNALLVPPVAPPPREPGTSRLPTAAAFGALVRPPLLIFCVAMLLTNISAIPFGNFFNVYLKEKLHLHDKWVGPLQNLGVVIEIPFVLAFARLRDTWGLRRLMIVGAVLHAVRMAGIAMYPNLAAALLTQAFHGWCVIFMYVSPPIFLNRNASALYRHSIQGLYVMFISGTSRIVANLMGGYLAQRNVFTLFWVCAALSLLAAVLLAVAFREEHQAHPGAT